MKRYLLLRGGPSFETNVRELSAVPQQEYEDKVDPAFAFYKGNSHLSFFFTTITTTFLSSADHATRSSDRFGGKAIQREEHNPQQLDRHNSQSGCGHLFDNEVDQSFAYNR